MKKNSIKKQDDYELRKEYDLSKMTVMPKGRFDPKRRIGSNIVVLEPDVAKAFPTEEAVNEALRSLINLAQKSIGLTKRSTGRAKKLHTGQLIGSIEAKIVAQYCLEAMT